MNEQEFNRIVNLQSRLSRDHFPHQSLVVDLQSQLSRDNLAHQSMIASPLSSIENNGSDQPPLSRDQPIRLAAHRASQMDVGLPLNNCTGLYHRYHVTDRDQSVAIERHFQC